MYVLHPSRPSPSSNVLMELVSIAIWNRNKIIIGIVIAVWGTSISFFLESESLLQTWKLTYTWFDIGIARVSYQFQLC
jgi:hypothetical protein